MNVIFTKKQVDALLSEDSVNVTYTTEKIEQFLQEATRDLTDSKKLYNIFFNKTIDLSISNIIENKDEVQKYLELIKNTEETLDKKHSKYFYIVDLYEYPYSDKNIHKLDRVTNDIDIIKYDIGRISDALEEVISASQIIDKLFSPNKENEENEER